MFSDPKSSNTYIKQRRMFTSHSTAEKIKSYTTRETHFQTRISILLLKKQYIKRIY
jgi:hypothetical protein